jgi:Heparinase II/III-like protein/Domain of unknown function (DUF4962)
MRRFRVPRSALLEIIPWHRRSRFALILQLLALLFAVSLPSAGRAQGDILKKIRSEHPRLVLTQADWEKLRAAIKNDPLKSSWYEQLRRAGETQMQRPRTRYRLDNNQLLFKSREALLQLSTFGALYRLTGEKRYAQAAREELLAVTSYPDWNPAHFLDTGEMTAAVAIGYDWTYDALDAAERKTIEAAILRLGLQPGLKAYDKPEWWVQNPNNWNIVCHGGLALGALAVAEIAPDIAEKTIEFALRDVPFAMRTWGPDGAWPEGLEYWAYTSQYNVLLIASLQSALGSDFGLLSIPGFSQAGFFPIFDTGPSGTTFNFADAQPEARPERAPQMFWLSRSFHQPAFATFELAHITPTNVSIWDLLYVGIEPLPSGKETKEPLPLLAVFHGVQDVGVARSSWEDPAAAWVALKGGDNSAGHAHLDLGSFVYEALGQRWVVDPGRDDYSLPGYFGKERWRYFRTSTRGHNTLLVDNQNQPIEAKAKITDSGQENGQDYFFVIDLSQAYNIGRVQRRIELVRGQDLKITDDIEGTSPHDILWNMITPANVDIRGPVATLSQNGRTVSVHVLSPADGRFQVLPGAGPPPEAQSGNLKRLALGLTAVRTAHIVVELQSAGKDTER